MIGKTILHYKIIEKLGEGGMGIVYLAEDTKLERQVAIKFLPRHIAGNSDERKRFEIEAKAAAALNHPNIATIYSIEEAENPSSEGKELFLVMEYIDGKELKEIVRAYSDTPQQMGDILNIATQIAEGLQAAHKKGIIHRDIKSSNIMVTEDGKVKIMDFGLAKFRGSVQVTQVGTTLGTAAYMSPEQARGEDVDQRSDIWSFGVVLYEMLTGKLPFSGDYEQAVFYAILHEDFIPISELSGSDTPNKFETISRKCLEKEVQNRYQNFEAIIEDLNSNNDDNISVKQTRSIFNLANGYFFKYKYILPAAILLMVFLFYFLLSGNIDKWLQSGPAEQHLTILPFKTIGGDSSNIAFCEGLVETFSSKLSQIEQYHGTLWVVPASEVRRNKIYSPSEANVVFGANLVVSGSLQIIEGLIRLTLNLIDAVNLRQLNSAVIDIEANELIRLQNKSVVKLLELLDLQLNKESRQIINAGSTTIPGAYEFYIQGLGYLKRYENISNLKTAVNLFDQAVEKDSLYSLAFAGLGATYWHLYEETKEKKWIDLAREKSLKAYDLNNELAEVNTTLGLVYSGTGNYNGAISVFNQALKVDPTNAAAFRGLAKVYQKLEKLDEAEATYKEAISLKPDYWGGYNDLGVFYFKQGQYEQAIKQFKQIILLTPDNNKGYNNLGGVYYMLKRWPEAEGIFRKSLDIKKTYRVCSNLGTLYYIKGEYDNAAHMYKMALDLNNSDYRVWGNLASAYYWSENNSKKAAEIYQKAIDIAEENVTINPDNANVIASLAGFYAMLNQDQKTLELIDRAISYGSKDVNVMFRVGTAFEQLGSRNKAIDWLIGAMANGYSRDEIESQPELKNLISDEQYKSKVNNIVSKQ